MSKTIALNYKDKKLDDIDIFRLKYINMIKSDEYSKMYDVSFLETQINTIVRIIKLNYLDNYAIIQSENSRFLETFMINCVSDEHFNNIFKEEIKDNYNIEDFNNPINSNKFLFPLFDVDSDLSIDILIKSPNYLYKNYNKMFKNIDFNIDDIHYLYQNITESTYDTLYDYEKEFNKKRILFKRHYVCLFQLIYVLISLMKINKDLSNLDIVKDEIVNKTHTFINNVFKNEPDKIELFYKYEEMYFLNNIVKLFDKSKDFKDLIQIIFDDLDIQKKNRLMFKKYNFRDCLQIYDNINMNILI